MSTATTATSPNITHLTHTPHAAHPIPLREQAFALHCQGLRSPAIAAELGVPERTIRAWIADALDDLKDDLQLNRRQQLLLAVERQNQLTATAWQQFEHEAAARDALLDAALDTLLNANDPNTSANTSPRAFHLHLPAGTPAPRYLSLILQANKETNRLLGLHTLATLHLLTPDVAEIPETDPVPFTDSDIPAESATGTSTPSTDDCDSPAKSATTSDLPSCSSLPSVSSVFSVSSVLNLRPPAESATDVPPDSSASLASFCGRIPAHSLAGGAKGVLCCAGSMPGCTHV